MTVDERIEELEKEVRRLKERRKDSWDKFGVIAAALIPLAIAGVGGSYSYWSQKAETEVAQIRADAESKIKQAELVSKFFEPLTGLDEGKKKFAVDSLLVAAPDYGPILIRIVAKNSKYAMTALTERRDVLIRQMFGEDSDQRKAAYQKLVASWGSDESLIPAIIKYGSDHRTNANGIYNTLVLLSGMPLEITRKHKDEILTFASTVESNGQKTKERADILRAQLK